MKQVLAIAIFILSGCVSPTIEEPELNFESELEILDSTCLGVFALRTPQFSEIDPWLPPGYKAGDSGEVFASAGAPALQTNRGLMGAFASSCNDQTVRLLNFWIFVEPPQMEGFASEPGTLNWFEVSSFYDNFPGYETLASWNMSMQETEIEVLDASTEVLSGREFLAGTDDVIFDIINFAAAPIFDLNGPIAIWQTNQAGTMVYETNLTAAADSGFGSCASDYQWIMDFMSSCDEQNLLLFGTIDDMTFGGTFRYYDDQFVK